MTQISGQGPVSSPKAKPQQAPPRPAEEPRTFVTSKTLEKTVEQHPTAQPHHDYLAGYETAGVEFNLSAQREANLKKLKPEERAAAQAAFAHLPENDAKAHDQLDEMLAECVAARAAKTPAAAQVAARYDGLWQALGQVAGASVREGMTAPKLLADLVHDVYDPNTISQGQSNDCPAGTLQMQLAEFQPAKYVELVGDLANESLIGAKLPGQPGRPFHFVEGSQDPHFKLHGVGDQRRASGRLFQAAAMNHAEDHGFDLQRDVGPDGRMGLHAAQAAKLTSALMGREFAAVMTSMDTDAGPKVYRAGVMGEIEAHVKAGETIQVGTLWSYDQKSGASWGHQVNVKGVTATSVTLQNPHGKIDTVPRDVFEQALTYAVLPVVTMEPK